MSLLKKPADTQRSEREYLPHFSTQISREWAVKTPILYRDRKSTRNVSQNTHVSTNIKPWICGTTRFQKCHLISKGAEFIKKNADPRKSEREYLPQPLPQSGLNYPKKHLHIYMVHFFECWIQNQSLLISFS